MGLSSSVNKNYVSIPPVTIVKGGGVNDEKIATAASVGASSAAIGALTANTYPETAQLNITGRGVINLANIRAGDAEARTLTMKIVIDGIAVLEVAGACTAAGDGVNGIGVAYYDASSSAFNVTYDQVPFAASFQIYVKSSATEADSPGTINYIYRTV